jgi:alpha-N-arabinofuranosidase
MYKVHQDATLLPVELQCGRYQFADSNIPSLNVSASRDDSGKIHISLCNLDPNKPAEIVCELSGVKAKSVSGRVLTAEAMTAHNTFDKPEAVKPAVFNDAKLKENVLTATLPAKSVVVLEVEQSSE